MAILRRSISALRARDSALGFLVFRTSGSARHYPGVRPRCTAHSLPRRGLRYQNSDDLAIPIPVSRTDMQRLGCPSPEISCMDIRTRMYPSEQNLSALFRSCISVRDTGIGIAKSFQTQIFSPFQQADTSLTRKHTGTGLGLAICYQLATSMHGNMGIWSQQGVGAGTELSVYLPINILTYDSEESNGRRLQPVHLDQPLSAARPVRKNRTR
jgi:hypothetical protein